MDLHKGIEIETCFMSLIKKSKFNAAIKTMAEHVLKNPGRRSYGLSRAKSKYYKNRADSHQQEKELLIWNTICRISIASSL